MNYKNAILGAFFVAFIGVTPIKAQNVPTPKEFFGFNIGDDYKLANYTQAEGYFKKVAAASDRVLLKEIGKSEEGRTQYVMVISSPANLKKIDRYKEISQKLARAENLTDQEAAKLALEGKPIIWIDGGLHATETVGAQQLLETYYALTSRTDAETMRILDDVIILLSQVNPDGQELVSDWYMSGTDDSKRNMSIPRLYQKYVGHDNNRDFFMNNMSETANISRQQYIEWMPQIIYNHHQTSPAGAVVAGPPYRDPFNFAYDPLLITGIDGVAASMINRLNAEGKPGYTRLSGSVYSTWWNGGLRTTPYFHNMIGLLTEITGNPTPTTIPLVPQRLIPNNATPYPVLPQTWKFRQSIDYSVSLNYGVLDYASRFGDKLLLNMYTMGRNAIEKGNKDTWTLTPKHIAAIEANYNKDRKAAGTTQGFGGGQVPMKYYDDVLKNPIYRDARGYVISANQKDFPTAVKFINSLLKSGVLVEKATAAFTANGKSFPAGSYIVKTNQAFRPHVLDMFEPQDHPNDFQYPGGPPVRPYDAAGWTLAYSMGVEVERVIEKLDGPFERVGYGVLQAMPAKTVTASSAGYLLSSTVNNSFIAVNQLIKAGVPVYRINKTQDNMPEGSFYTTSKGMDVLKKAGMDFGTDAKAVSKKPSDMRQLSKARIALFDQYGGSMPSGWVRWIFEQFQFPFDVVYPQDIDKGNLNAKYDVILFIDGGIPQVGPAGPGRGGREMKAEDVPAEFRNRIGSITADKSIPVLKSFIENGGNVVAVGSSAVIAYHLNVPVKNALAETKDGKEVNLPGEKYYIPGSLLKAYVDTKSPINWGLPAEVDVVFDSSPVFKLDAGAEAKGVKPLAWFGKEDALRSGWAWGQSYLKDGVVAFVAPIGKGNLHVYTPEITFRAQAHGTYKMLFNNLYVQK